MEKSLCALCCNDTVWPLRKLLSEPGAVPGGVGTKQSDYNRKCRYRVAHARCSVTVCIRFCFDLCQGCDPGAGLGSRILQNSYVWL